MKEDMSLSNLGTAVVALHAAKVPTNLFSSTLICILTLDYFVSGISGLYEKEFYEKSYSQIAFLMP